MVEFVLAHPDYLLIMFLCFFLVVKVVIHIANENPGDHDDENDGGVEKEDPILDLPPGVTLPDDQPQKELVI